MTWEAVGAIGELVGALAVVVSLVYLAYQVRGAALVARAETELEAARLWSEFHARVAHSPDMARIWDNGHRDADSLSEVERQRFIWLVAEYLFLVEGLYKQWKRGFISDATWQTHERTIVGLLDNPLLRGWWKSGVSPYSDSFIARIDRLLERGVESTWSYTPLAELGDG